MILSGLVFFTNTRKDVEYFTKTVNQTQDDEAITTGTMITANTRLFNNSNMVNSRYSHETILTAKHRKALPFCAVSFAWRSFSVTIRLLPGYCYAGRNPSHP